MYDKIAHQQLKKFHYSQWKRHHKGTEEHSDKNIGSRNQNTLTANEAQLKK